MKKEKILKKAEKVFEKMQGVDQSELNWLFIKGYEMGAKDKEKKHRNVAYYQTTFSRIYHLNEQILHLESSLESLLKHPSKDEHKNLVDEIYIEIMLSKLNNELKYLKEKTKFDEL